jgi:hypothetical protein
MKMEWKAWRVEGKEKGAKHTQRRNPLLWPGVAFLLVDIVCHCDELRVVEVVGEGFALVGCPFGGAGLYVTSVNSVARLYMSEVRLLSCDSLVGEKKLEEERTLQAFANGTTWSISTSLACVQVSPSYGEYHEPPEIEQPEPVETPVPSRTRTRSRVSQELSRISVAFSAFFFKTISRSLTDI